MRWRFYMIVGMNLLAIIIAGTYGVITVLEQRAALNQLHTTTARQVQTVTRTALDTAGEHDGTSLDALLAGDTTLLDRVLAADMGDSGYAYLVDSSGRVLAGEQVAWDEERDPTTFAVYERAQDGQEPARIYHGLTGRWVIGRAEAIPGTTLTIITETPGDDLLPTVVRVLALWALALVITLVVGEILIRRILRTVLTPVHILHRGARAVAAGDYRYRIRIPPNTDRELVELGDEFNIMIRRLHESQQQIDAYTHQMREIVDQRARELSRKAMQLEVAAEVSSKIATILDPRELSHQVATLIKDRFEVYHADILEVDQERGQLRSGLRADGRKGPVISLHDSNVNVVAWAAQHGTTLYVPDVTEDPRYQPAPDRPASRCQLAIPLKFADRVIGVLNLEADHRNAFPKDEMAVLESLANEIAVSMHNAQVFDALETANRDLAQATLQAKQANTLKSRFLFNASHKLRTPLNAIIGYSETMLSGIYGELPETAADRQRRILENGRHLQALVEDMLDLSELETGQVALNLTWVSLTSLLDEVMNAARALHQAGYPDHDLDLRLDLMHLGEPLPPVWADLDRLRYILINLMSNAIKFTESGTISLSAGADEDQITITVHDTGPGIGEDEIAVLFQPFQHQRGSTESAGRGTGLGLPVSRLLAMRHGGDLTVESKLHEGSSFTVTLPRYPDGAPPPPA